MLGNDSLTIAIYQHSWYSMDTLYIMSEFMIFSVEQLKWHKILLNPRKWDIKFEQKAKHDILCQWNNILETLNQIWLQTQIILILSCWLVSHVLLSSLA